MSPTWFPSSGKLHPVRDGMILAALAAYVTLFVGLGGWHSWNPLDWLATLVESRGRVLLDLFLQLQSLVYSCWYFLPAGALFGALLSRRLASRGRSRAAFEAAVLGLAFGMVSFFSVLLFFAALSSEPVLPTSLETWLRVSAVAFGVGAYCSCWLVAFVYWQASKQGRLRARSLPS